MVNNSLAADAVKFPVPRIVAASGSNLWWLSLEARPIVLVVFTLRLAVGGMGLGGGHSSSFAHVTVGHLSWLCGIASIYLLNGVTDIRGDRENRSERPLAAGRLSVKTASTSIVLLAATSVALAALVSGAFFLEVMLLLIVGIAYSAGRRPMKNHAGSAAAATAVAGGLTYFAGMEAYGRLPSPPIVVFAAMMGLWIAAAGAAKDFGDARGDLLAGRRTLPVLFGATRARSWVTVTSTSVALVGVALTAVFPAVWPLTLLLPAAVWVGVLARRISPQSTRAQQRRPYQVFMASQYSVNILAIAIGLATLL